MTLHTANIGTRFAELAQATASKSELSDFGKCVTLFVAAVSLAVENGFPIGDVDEILASTKAAALATAGQLVAETTPDDTH
jgi:hypothetical protein